MEYENEGLYKARGNDTLDEWEREWVIDWYMNILSRSQYY